jgi:hypothetical protein
MRVTWDRFKVLTRVTTNHGGRMNAQMIYYVFIPINRRIPLNPSETGGDRNAFWRHINDGNDGSTSRRLLDRPH